MTALQLLVTLHERAVSLCLTPEGDLRFRAPSGAFTPGLRASLRASKTEVAQLLRHPQRGARSVWEEAVREIARVWGEHKREHGAAPWLPPEVEEPLEEEVAAALRVADLPRAVRAAARWREAWRELLKSPGDEPPATGSPEALAVADELIAESEGRRPRANPTVAAMFEETRGHLDAGAPDRGEAAR